MFWVIFTTETNYRTCLYILHGLSGLEMHKAIIAQSMLMLTRPATLKAVEWLDFRCQKLFMMWWFRPSYVLPTCTGKCFTCCVCVQHLTRAAGYLWIYYMYLVAESFSVINENDLNKCSETSTLHFLVDPTGNTAHSLQNA